MGGPYNAASLVSVDYKDAIGTVVNIFVSVDISYRHKDIGTLCHHCAVYLHQLLFGTVLGLYNLYNINIMTFIHH